MVLPFLFLGQQPTANNPHRFALIVGNSTYAALPRATSAIAEAHVMKDALASAGFAVTLLENLKNDDFFTQETQFLASVHQGDFCLFYFSGHAAQIEGDDDYLLPVDFQPASDQAMEDRAVRLTRLIQDLDQRQASLKIFVIEAPRRTPTIIRGASGVGLSMPDIRSSKGTLVALAAGVGQFVIPPQNPNGIGIFTQRIAGDIGKPGLRLSSLFDEAKQEVGRGTNQQQLPDWNDTVLPDGFYFHEPIAAKIVEPPPPEVKVERILVPTAPQNRKDRLEYVHIPAGTFKMGCVPADNRCDSNEKPRHTVTISHSFWMGRTEVEVSAYQRFVEESGKKYKMPKATLYNRGWNSTNLPMMMVTWDEANAYCGWAGGRLPTEAEWEYAARGGKDDEVYPLNAENSRDKANFMGKKGNDIYEQLAPVKSFDANPVGLYDMAGNVWEYVADWFSPDYYKESPAADPKGPASGKEHVKRGGSFESNWQKDLRISVREPQGPSLLFKVGFRCVLDETPQTKQILNLP